MSGAGIRVDRDGAVAVVVLGGTHPTNRFEGTMREDLLDAVTSAGADDEVRAVMITGAGDAFSAGADIEGMVALHDQGRADEIGRRVELGTAIVDEIQAMPKPVVAALGGVAAGAGANLALACDIRLGSTDARFSESFVRIGLIPDWGGFASLLRLVGAGRAADLCMTGAVLDAERMERIGLLDRVFPAASFRQDALAYVRRLASGPPAALAQIKRGLALASSGTRDELAEFERRVQAALFAEPDCREGMRAFLDKRQPVFGDTPWT